MVITRTRKDYGSSMTAFRKCRKLTVYEFAKIAGITSKEVYAIEKGDNRYTASSFEKYSKAMALVTRGKISSVI
jgi:transcriptional regulator with XRE-family HTH domain